MTEEERDDPSRFVIIDGLPFTVSDEAWKMKTHFAIGGKHYPVENVTIKMDYQETEYDTVKTATRFEVHGNVYAKGKRQYKRSFRRLWQVTHGLSNSRKADGWRRHVRRMKAKRHGR